jgi:hypothetical protein
MQIKCPACQNDITIPQRPPAVRVTGPASHPPSPPPPMPSSVSPPAPLPPTAAAPLLPPAAAPPLPRSGLSVAREAPPPPPQFETAPARPIGGQPSGTVQWAGLIGAFLVTAIIIGMAATWKPPERNGNLVFGREKRGRKYVLAAKQRDTSAQKTDAVAGDDDADEKPDVSSASTPANVPPARPQWTLDLRSAQIPNAQANGQISGGPFTAERALLQRTPTGYLLMVRQGAGPQMERELWVSLPLKPGEKLDGNTWNITENTTTAAPRIVKRWVQNARQQTKTFTNGYAMKLEFSQTQSNELPARLFVALPDEEKSFVAGTLKASFLVAAAPAVQPSPQPQQQRPPPQQQQQQQPRRLPRLTY